MYWNAFSELPMITNLKNMILLLFKNFGYERVQKNIEH